MTKDGVILFLLLAQTKNKPATSYTVPALQIQGIFLSHVP